MTDVSLIRNFCVISHIDHGKTTLTDRLLELTHATNASKRTQRLLDSNPIEQERGITIKLAPARLTYRLNSKDYILNLIDTPGHVDFGYEVSRSLAACEGAVLLIDATQGIQAQTLANAYKALDANLELIPVINKIDLPNAETAKTIKQLNDTFGFLEKDIIKISAKTGENVIQLIEAIIKRVPAPLAGDSANTKALIFNSFYHTHKGVIAYVRVFSGTLTKQEAYWLISTQTSLQAEEIGIFTPSMKPIDQLFAGEVGYIATGLKDLQLCRVGDTIVRQTQSDQTPFPGYHEPQSMVFMDLYPTDNHDFVKLKEALEKLQLVDSSFNYKPAHSPVLGSGFKVGFQGMLHAEIIQERLEREFDLDLIVTSPSVEYQVQLHKNQQLISIFSPSDMPDPTLINQINEPYASVTIFTPTSYLGSVITLSQLFRATLINQQHFGDQVSLIYHMPLQELIGGFFARLKTVSSGFASLDWQFLDFRPSPVVKLDVLLNREIVEPLSVLVIRSKAETLAKKLARTLKETIPRQQFEVPIQIALGGKILARETVKSFRKDVTAKLYGGDRTRAMKLLQKQKKGKKRLKQIGKINLPQEAFLAILQN